ncbi:MAG: low molecular weight protein-tyrosine-phosphatase [Mucinivorans sp.]
MTSKYKILFVCLGNICRSAAAEGIMNSLLEQRGLTCRFEVDSAGTFGGHQGQRADARMRKAALARGYYLESLSRKITMDDFFSSDIILAMDDSVYDELMDLSVDVASGAKVHRMVEFCTHNSASYVPDPYYEGVDGFSLVMDILEDGCCGLLAEITKS